MKNYKIRIVKINKFSSSDDYSCVAANLTDWEEITENEYVKITNSIAEANLNYEDEYLYRLVEFVEKEEVFQKAAQWVEKQKAKAKEAKDRIEKERLKKEEQKRIKAAKSLETKRKQLERLKKELGE